MRPLHVAVLNNDADMVEKLLTKFADVNRCDSNGLTPLQLACDQGYTEVTETLLDNGTLIRHAPGTLPPLILAVRGRHCECVELLLGHDADPHVDDGRGNTALTLAQQNNDIRSVRALVQHGAV
jgi:ankyrin repeat protein